jgi:hypothetical protein
MYPSKSYNHTPERDDQIEHGGTTDFIEQLEEIKAAIAEAEDICAEFAIEMYLEVKRLSKEIGEPH